MNSNISENSSIPVEITVHQEDIECLESIYLQLRGLESENDCSEYDVRLLSLNFLLNQIRDYMKKREINVH